ncbi:MAG: hypothetical protein DRR06_01035 [Gammaproteobacteria bacterium]|nr:MAG: hypothetical protein DRR06_01035 [Gammaproteobacteria bacterium]RLA54939.1 MAG: hypothetical protein DRR42_00100 [Gammaproteobacteria bacterium]
MAMTLQDLGNIGEFIGAIGVVITLIYLAMQIRQNTASVRTAAGMDTARQVAAWVDRMAVHPDLCRIYNLAAEDPESLEPEEQARFVVYIAEMFFIYEAQFQMYSQNHLSEEMWAPKRNILLGYLKNSLVETWWIKRSLTFSEPFVAHIENCVLSRRIQIMCIRVLRPYLTKKVLRQFQQITARENKYELGCYWSHCRIIGCNWGYSYPDLFSHANSSEYHFGAHSGRHGYVKTSRCLDSSHGCIAGVVQDL